MVRSVSVIVWCLYSWTLFRDTLVFGKPHGNDTTIRPTITEILTEIPDGQSSMTKVNLSYNEISQLADYVFFNKNYARAESIELYRNKISDIDAYAFWGLEQLKVLDLSDNLIRTLDEQTFGTNRKLHRLILVNNRISFERQKRFLISDSIETLALSNNRISEIYDITFQGLPKLKRLLLTDNTLTVLGKRSFETLTHLRYLSLANTGVYQLTEAMFAKLPHAINLEDTPLSQNFEPPLTHVRGHAVKHLLQINTISKQIIHDPQHTHHNVSDASRDEHFD